MKFYAKMIDNKYHREAKSEEFRTPKSLSCRKNYVRRRGNDEEHASKKVPKSVEGCAARERKTSQACAKHCYANYVFNVF